MRLLRDYPIRLKVLVPPAILALGMVVLYFSTTLGIHQLTATIDTISVEILERITLIDDIVITSEQVQSDVFQISVLKSMGLPDESILPLKSRLESQLSDLSVSYGKISGWWELDKTEMELLEQIQKPLDSFRTQAKQAASVVIRDAALGVVLVRSSTIPFQELQMLLADLREYEQALITGAKEKAQKESQRINSSTALATLIIILAAIISTLFISTTQISKPIQEITKTMTRLAEGDVSGDIKDQNRQDEFGKMAQTVSVFRETMISKDQAEAELIESQRAMAALLDNLPGFAYRCQNDPEWTTEFISDGCHELTGYRPKDLIGNAKISYNGIIHPDDQKMVRDTIQKALAEKTTFQIEYRLIPATGAKKWVWERGFGIYAEDEELQFLEGFVTDITQRKQAQAAQDDAYQQVISRQAAVLNLTEDLQREVAERRQAEKTVQRQNEFLLALQEITLELLSELELDKLLHNIVTRAGQFVGTSSGFLDLIDEKSGQLVPSVGVGVLEESLQHMTQPGVGVAGMVWKTSKPIIVDNYDGWAERIDEFSTNAISSIIGVPILTSGEVIGVLGLAHEAKSQKIFGPDAITYLTQFAQLVSIAIENARLYSTAKNELVVRKQSEKEREKLVAELEARNREMEAFVYTISHDLKAPLISIDGFSAALQINDNLGEQGQHYLERIRANSANMSVLITELLELSRVGRVVGQYENTNIPVLLNEIFSNVGIELPNPMVTIQDPLAEIFADRIRIRQIFSNLINNAIKFQSPNRKLNIIIGCHPGKNSDTFWVQDNGIGIEPKHLKRIFEPFQQLNSNVQGVGIGLTLIRKIIEHHGGQIWVESQPDEGTTFYFTISTKAQGMNDE